MADEVLETSNNLSTRRFGHSEICDDHVALEMIGIETLTGQLSKGAHLTTNYPNACRLSDEDGKEMPLDILPKHEREILKKQVGIPEVKTRLTTLYRYATTIDLLIIGVSAFCAIAGGATLPLTTVCGFRKFGRTFQHFFEGTLSHESFTQNLRHFVLYFLYLGVAQFVTVYIGTVGFMYTGDHISRKIREQYLAAILHQNMAFFDNLGASEITTRIISDTNLIQDGMSEKVAITLNAMSTFVSAFVIGYVKYWKLALILSATVIATILVVGGGTRFIVKNKKKSLDAYALGGTIVEEVLNSIKIATAFGTRDKLAEKYEGHLLEAEKWSFKPKAFLAIMVSCWFCIIYLNNALAFWIGSKYLVAGEMSLSDIIVVVMTIMIGAFSISNVVPNIQSFTTAISAAGKIFTIIDRVPPLDPTAQA